jgi:lipooligosaccharide transport system permease protein
MTEASKATPADGLASHLMDSWWAIRCVWLRYFAVFLKSFKYYLVTTFLEPILYLLSFGFGVGSLIGAVKTQGMDVSYRSFIFSGIIAQTVLFQGFFEAAYGGFVRMYYQRIFQAMAITPITLSEVLWGELLWDASKATVASLIVAVIGVAVGSFPVVSLLLLLPVCFFSALLFSGMGLITAAYSQSIEEISYPQYLLVFPMFLFCGVFYPIENLPGWVQVAAWFFPLTSVISLVRTITLGFPFQPQAVPILIAWLVGLVIFSRRAMFKRLVK